MKVAISLALLSIVLAEPNTFPTFEINLDLPEDQRFFAVSQHFSSEIMQFLTYFETKYTIPLKIATGIFDATSWIWDVTQHKKYKEIEGIVKGVNNKDLTMPKAVILNSIYEFEAWCTSIIVKQTDGTIIHSRNLDFNVQEDIMRSMTYNAKYMKDGKYLFDAVMFGATIGTYTGMKANGFSIS